MANIDNTDPIQMLQGYDSFLNTHRQVAVTGTTTPTIGPKDTLDCTVCTSFDQVQTALRISASASASFAFGSVDAKASYSQSLNVTDTSVAVVVYANKVSGAQQVTGAAFTPAALEELKRSPLTFFKDYGDSYVNRIVYGGEFYATYIFQAHSEQEQKDLAASISGHNLTVSASLDTTLKEIRDKSTTSSIVRMGKAGIDEADPDENAIATYAKAFAGKTLSPSPIIVSVTGYDRVPDGNIASVAPIVAARELYIGDGTEQPGGLLKDYAKLRKAALACERLADIYDFYDYTGDTQLATKRNDILADMDTIQTLVSEMAKDPTRTFARPQLSSVAHGVPVLNAPLGNSQYFGGATGDDLFYNAGPTSVETKTRLSSIQARVEKDRDSFTRIMQLRLKYTSTGGSYTTRDYGNDTKTDGAWYPEWSLPEGDPVREIHILYGGGDGAHVHKIVIKTEGGTELNLPYDDNPLRRDNNNGVWPDPADPTASRDKKFVGFAGRYRGWIHQMAVIYAQFKPATWKAHKALTAPAAMVAAVEPLQQQVSV